MRFIEVAERKEVYGQKITESSVVAKYMRDVEKLDRESIWTLYVDSRLNIVGRELVSLGTLVGAIATPREILKGAILNDASAIILVHNHPSGDPTPSAEDLKVTKDIKDACKLFQIDFLDHVIISSTGKHFSFADNKYLN